MINPLKRSVFRLFIICSCFLTSQVLSFEKLEQPRSIVASVVIPCHYKHAPYLIEALEAYAAQTVLPDEVVISLSEVDRVSPEIVMDIENRNWPFSLVLLKHKKPISEGGNRNRACFEAKGDILICSDADDLPHWQRIEIIKYFFENYPIDYLIHTFLFDPASWQSYDPTSIPFSTPSYINQGGPHANGAITISRTIARRYQWDEQFRQCVDATYNERVFNQYPNGVLINIPIYHYRYDLSVYPH